FSLGAALVAPCPSAYGDCVPPGVSRSFTRPAAPATTATAAATAIGIAHRRRDARLRLTGTTVPSSATTPSETGAGSSWPAEPEPVDAESAEVGSTESGPVSREAGTGTGRSRGRCG